MSAYASAVALFNKKSPEDRFAADVAKQVRSLLGATVEQRDDFALEVVIAGHSPRTFLLHNIWHETQGIAEAERSERIRTAILALNGPPRPETWDDAQRALLPALRVTSWISAAEGNAASEHFLPLLDLLVAIDTEHAMSFVTAADLERWGVSLSQAVSTAIQNMRGLAVPHERLQSFYAVTGPDGYASSWLVAPDRLASIADDVPPPILVLAPTRDDVFILSGDDPELPALLRRSIAQALSHPRGFTAQPFLIEDGAASLWQPASDHPAAGLVQHAANVLELRAYAEQKARLDEEFERAGIDTFVATYTLVHGRGDWTWSWSMWVRGVESALLPRTTHVRFADPADPDSQFMVRWEDAEGLAAMALTREPDYDPPRWRYVAWPSETAIKKLQALAVDAPGEN
ncbi:MAG: hypothetical protein QOC73_1326 [Actinomycetota bacterium]|nr:hypothetical protein [Actinomycetota bacterium]